MTLTKLEEFVYKKMFSLKEEIDKHNISYYRDNNPSISDTEYDKLYSKLMEYERDYPELVNYDSPIKCVGSDLTDGFKKVPHDKQMLSIQNALTQDELINWIFKIDEYTDIVVEYKIDGAALSLVYKDGILKRAVTRGDGEKGDDITENARMIHSIPLTIPFVQDIEIRGEVYLPKMEFERLKVDHPEYKNARNLASGSMKLHDSNEVRKRGLYFMAYEVLDPCNCIQDKLPHGKLNVLNALGFKTTPYHVVNSRDIDHIINYCDEINEQKENYQYDIDGLVFKINSYLERELLGHTSKFHRWQIAYKFPQKEIITKLEGIEVQVGRTGEITPIALLKPVEILGTTVSRATLHNYSQIKKLGLKLNDTIILEKGGEIIPKVVGVKNHAITSVDIDVPRNCPVCQYMLYSENKDDYDKSLKCRNEFCPAKLQGRIEHFVCKYAFNIKNLGPSIIEKLIEEDLIESPEELFDLIVSDLMSIDRVGEPLAVKLKRNITNSMNIDLKNFIYSLGIPAIGRTLSGRLAEKLETVQHFKCYATYEDEIRSVLGEKTYEDFVWFMDREGYDLTENLLERGIIVNNFEKIEVEEHFLNGQKVVITGTLSAPRDEIKEKLIGFGAVIVGSVSKNTDYLIVGENPGSKYRKAIELGITVIKEEEL